MVMQPTTEFVRFAIPVPPTIRMTAQGAVIMRKVIVQVAIRMMRILDPPDAQTAIQLHFQIGELLIIILHIPINIHIPVVPAI